MEQHPEFEKALASLNAYLLEHGMRRTPERTAILRMISCQTEPFTADQLWSMMEEQFHVSRATIYYALELFLKLGFIVCHTFGSTLCFEQCFSQRDHFYQVCVHCGRHTRVKSTSISAAINNTAFRRFRVDSISLSAFGVCSICRTALTKAHNKYVAEQKARKQARAAEKAAAKAQKGAAGTSAAAASAVAIVDEAARSTDAPATKARRRGRPPKSKPTNTQS